jgi:hypothetical protein
LQGSFPSDRLANFEDGKIECVPSGKHYQKFSFTASTFE